MTRQILNPRWGNDTKTHIIATFRYDDGKEFIASITNEPNALPNPDWAEIIEKYGVEQIDSNTDKSLKRHMARRQAEQENRAIENERREREALFNVKAEIFDMEVVKNSQNREVKNKIRRATTITEAQVYAAVLHILEDPIVQKQVSKT